MDKARLRSAYGRLPLSFEENQGQVDSQVKFLSRGAGYNLFLTESETVLTLRQPEKTPKGAKEAKASNGPEAVKASQANSALVNAHGLTTASMAKLEKQEPEAYSVLRLKLAGANPHPRVSGDGKQPGIVNYFLGKNTLKWQTHVGLYDQVRYKDVYPGIDQVYYGNQQKMEYDFVVAPHADADQVRLSFAGADNLSINTQGDLIVHLAGGPVLRQKAPVVYQGELAADGKPTHTIECEYFFINNVGTAKNCPPEVGFRIGKYDHAKPLTIDPVLIYSTILGGSGLSTITAIAVDSLGCAYVTGSSNAIDFPTTEGAFQTPVATIFVTKLDPDGVSLIYSDFFGGSNSDGSNAIAVDNANNAYVTGTTSSVDFPTTQSALQTVLKGVRNVFISKFSGDGTALLFSTYLGGSDNTFGDKGGSIAIDGSDNAYVAGATSSVDFPTTVGAFQTTLNGLTNAFVSKLRAF